MQLDPKNYSPDTVRLNPDLFGRGPGKTALPIVQNGQAVERPSRRQKRATIAATEKQIQDAMIDLLRMTGWLILRVNGGSMVADSEGDGKARYVRFAYWYGPGAEGDSGIADIIAMKDGRCILVEVKRPDKRGNLSAKQQAFQGAAVAAGVEHYVLCSVEELEAIL